MPLAAVCWISITNGKASETPASASGPRRPRNSPSNVIMPAIARRLRTFGAESRSSVDRTGPSSSNLVRAAAGRTAVGWVATVGDNDGREFAMLWLLMVAPSRTGLRAAPETEACVPATHHFSASHYIFSITLDSFALAFGRQ